MRAWRVRVAGILAIYRASTRARAKYLAARDAHAGGWGPVGELLKTAVCVREYGYDSGDDHEGVYTLRTEVGCE